MAADTKIGMVLVVDDDRAVLESVEAILTKRGYAVTLAGSGAEGLALAKQVAPDLILCDMMMERVDAGLTFVADLRTGGLRTPVVLLSSISDKWGATMDFADAGFVGVMQKPIEPATLLRVVETNLKK